MTDVTRSKCEWCGEGHRLRDCPAAPKKYRTPLVEGILDRMAALPADTEVGAVVRVPRPGAVVLLPADSAERKDVPICAGVLDYFPAALAEVAKVSKAGNDKHNPGEPLHHARGKSMDHADCIARHLLERGTIDPSDGLTHTAHLAWRALAMLQEELEAAGAPMARGAR